MSVYKTFGEKGLMRSRKNETYTFEFKLHMVELYLSTEVSYQELALSVGINNPTLITKWVNQFRIAGPDILQPKRKGRQSKVSKSKESKTTNIESTNDYSNYLKQLEEENLKLRIENAYLKELRGLRLEEEALLKKTARIIYSLRGDFKLKDILAVVGFPKATYMYWQKRFNRKKPNAGLEQKILEIRKENKDFGYRRIYGELRKQGLVINKKRVQKIVQKLGLQVSSFTRKSRKYSSYRGKVGKVAPNRP